MPRRPRPSQLGERGLSLQSARSPEEAASVHRVVTGSASALSSADPIVLACCLPPASGIARVGHPRGFPLLASTRCRHAQGSVHARASPARSSRDGARVWLGLLARLVVILDRGDVSFHGSNAWVRGARRAALTRDFVSARPRDGRFGAFRWCMMAHAEVEKTHQLANEV